MSRQKVDLVRGMMEAFVGPKPARALAFFDSDVVYDARERPDGEGSGVPLEQRGANLVTVGAGGILHVRLYLNRREALRAAGLEQSAL